MAASRDTEITLGTGRMLALFFGLVGICALFFGLGYSLGKSSSKPPIMAEQPPIKSEPKPAPPKPAASAKPGDMTFYQAVKQDDTTAQTPPASPAPADSSDSPVAAATAAEVNPQPLVGTIDNGGYFVQVAAVSKKAQKTFSDFVGSHTQIMNYELFESEGFRRPLKTEKPISVSGSFVSNRTSSIYNS